MSWFSAVVRARTMRTVGAVAVVVAALSPVSSAPSASAADPAAPKIASTSYPSYLTPSAMRWRGAFRSATPTYRWKPASTTGVAKYQVQTWHGSRNGSYIGPASTPPLWSEYGSVRAGYQSTIATYPASRTSVAGAVYSGDQVCRRVRAVNAAGSAGSWSGWRCTYAPLGDEELERGFDVTPFGYYVHNSGASVNPVQSGTYLAQGVRIRVRTGPTYGKAKVYIGSTLLGTVDGHAKKSGYKNVVRKRSANVKGAIKIKAISRRGDTFASERPFRFTGLWALRSTTSLSGSKVVAKGSVGDSGLETSPVTSTDKARPKMTAFAVSSTFPTKRNRNGVYSVKATWKGSDNVKVAGYEVATKRASGTSYVEGGSSTTTSTSMPMSVDWDGSSTCHRIRAYDAAGNRSAWTTWKCSHAPVPPMGLNWTSHSGAEAGGKIWTSVRTLDDYGKPARTTDRYSAKKLRIEVRVGPTRGRAKVYVGSTSFGTVNAYAKKAGTKWVTLSAKKEVHERIRFAPLTKKDVYIGKVFVLPDLAKAVSPGPARY